jgi:hypothetical protein
MTVVISGSSGIQNVLGSAAAPAESNTTSSNTGLYFPTSTTLGLSTAGTNAVYIDASQNVGIGTTSPAAKLEVSSATLGEIRSTITSSAGNVARLALKSPVSNYAWYVSDNVNALVAYDYNASAERMRIDSSGNLLVGTASAGGKSSFVTGTTTQTCVYVQTPASFSNFAHWSNSLATASTSWYHFYGTSSNNTVANIAIFGNGNIQNANNSYGSLSDIKLKENVVDASPKLAGLMQVRVVNYNLKGELGYETHKQIGVIAQELEQVFPSLVHEMPDKDKDGNDLSTTTKGVKMSVFVPMLIKAIQEQQALITTLTARIEALEAR